MEPLCDGLRLVFKDDGVTVTKDFNLNDINKNFPVDCYEEFEHEDETLLGFLVGEHDSGSAVTLDAAHTFADYAAWPPPRESLKTWKCPHTATHMLNWWGGNLEKVFKHIFHLKESTTSSPVPLTHPLTITFN
jgi:hypothetical protein